MDRRRDPFEITAAGTGRFFGRSGLQSRLRCLLWGAWCENTKRGGIKRLFCV